MSFGSCGLYDHSTWSHFGLPGYHIMLLDFEVTISLVPRVTRELDNTVMKLYRYGKKVKIPGGNDMRTTYFLWAILILALVFGCSKKSTKLEPVPDTPTLYYPANDSTINDNTPSFDWSDPAHAYRYELIVDNNNSFTSPEIQQTDLSSSNYTPSSGLSDDTYYWKVRAKNSEGAWGTWSTTWSFILNTSSSLSAGKVSPGGGTISETYTYTVVFTDPLNTAPHASQVFVDGIAHTMAKIGGNFNSGATYRYQTSLTEGSHTYRFQFHDSRDSLIYYPTKSYETGPIVTKTTAIVYDSSTVLVDEQDSLSLSSVSGSVYTYTYTGLPPDIKVGDIILSTDTAGYLRKVVSKTISGNQLILDTKQASLAEAFTRIVLDTTVTLSFSGSPGGGKNTWGRQPYLAPGVQIRAGEIILDGQTLFDGLVNGKHVSITIDSGSFSFQPSLNVGWDIGLFSQEVHAIASGTAALDLKPKIEASAAFSKSGEVLITYLPIPLEWASIPASIDFSLYAGYEASMNIAGHATFDMSGQATVTVGGRYQDGDFSTIWETDSDWSAGSPVWGAEGNANAKVYLRPEISIKVLHVAGPYADVVPYLDFDGSVTLNPYCWEWGIYAGLEANVGLELDIFVYSKSFSKQLFSIEKKLAGGEDCPEMPPTNVALQQNGGIATAISEGTYLGQTQYAYYANDGTSSTSWSDYYDMPAWLRIEFDRIYAIDSVGVWWGSHQHTFSISLSADSNSWTTVVPSRLSNNSEESPPIHESFAISSTNAKYIRIDITTTSAPWTHIFQATVAELEAYGH
jgi:hypothetical protein